MSDQQKDYPETSAGTLVTTAKHFGDTAVAPGHAIGAIALDMAMKYHDINMVKDGVLYQQYKLEGRNMRDLHLDAVFETAMKIEMHLLGASDRIARMVVDALAVDEDDDADTEEPSQESPPSI